MNEMINKIQALIESQEEEIKEIEELKKDVKVKLDFNSFSLPTCKMFFLMLLEHSLHLEFIQMLKDVLSENQTNEEEV